MTPLLIGISTLAVLAAAFFGQQQIRLRKQLNAQRAAMQAKDEVLSLIGHNLRGPLNSTVGLEEIIEEYIQEKDWQEIRETFRELDQNLGNLRHLVEKLMAYSLSVSSPDSENLETGSVAALLRETADRFGKALEQKNLSLEIEVEDARIQTDPLRLSAALGAVLDNAIRFSPAHSTLKLTGNYLSSQNRYEIDIRDNGPGFTPGSPFTFSRKDIRPDSEGHKGDGLGLITAQGCIRSIGGTIFAAETDDPGACVRVSIPALRNISPD